jgi:uncharacterized DUF497 family protein
MTCRILNRTMVGHVMRRVEKLEFASFEWDDAKEQSNIKKHGIGFDEALAALTQPHIEQRSDRTGEARMLAVCPLFGRIITVIYARRGDALRIISARAARDDEKEQYRDHYLG